MKLLEKILMPVDVNYESREQLDTVVKIAKEFNSEVILIYVLPESERHPEVQELLTKFINESLGKIAKVLENNKVKYSEPLLTSGNIVDSILEAATEKNVNLILVGSGEQSGNNEFRLGINAEKLVRLSDVPVWVAKSEQDFSIRRILCPVDFSDPAKRALRNAILLANTFDASLHILGVFEPFNTTSPRIHVNQDAENEKLRSEYKRKLEDFLQEFKLDPVVHDVEIQTGTPSEKILESIRNGEADLLVMGTNGRSGFSRIMLGSVTEKVIRELPCSFLTTKTQNIYQLKLDTEVKEIEIHFNNAAKLLKSGFYKEAMEQYMICLKINDMHIPSIYQLAKVHKILGNNEKMEYYDKMAQDLLRRLWDKKIEYEIRMHYRSDA